MLLVEPALKKGAKGGAPWGQGPPPTPFSTLKAAGTVSGAAGLAQGVKVAVAVWSPQVGGVTSGPRGPPSKRKRRWETGNWGTSWPGSPKVVVSWPLTGSASTLPASLTRRPRSRSRMTM